MTTTRPGCTGQLGARAREQLAFVRRLARFRREQPQLQRDRYDASARSWFGVDGSALSAERLAEPHGGVIVCLLHGDREPVCDERGQPERGRDVLVLMNASALPVSLTLPATRDQTSWQLALETTEPTAGGDVLPSHGAFELAAHALAVFVPA